VYVLDSKGRVVRGRQGVTAHKAELATDPALLDGWDAGDHVTLDEVVRNVRPDILIGVTGQGGLFTEALIREMASHVKRPIIMPLSNPTAKTEVTPDQAIAWTEGRAIVATGSPFADVVYDGRRRKVGQANNVFVFPGVGLGVIAANARQVTTGMFVAAARTLAACVDDSLLAVDCLYPPISDVRRVSRRVAAAVAKQAVAEGVAPPFDHPEVAVDATMWFPDYLPYRPD
jgi:malate dehydrogenase (oxaloacetate-decarboxylating)